MNEFHYSVSLSLQHPSIDPQEITTTLHQFPCHTSIKVGDFKKLPNGKNRQPEERSEYTYWQSSDLHSEKRVYSGDQEVSDLLRSQLEKLLTHRNFLEEFTKQGWA